MVTSFFVSAYRNQSQAWPLLLKRVNGQLLRVAIANSFKDELALGKGFLAVDGWLEAVGGMEGLVSTTGRLDKVNKLCLGFLWTRQLRWLLVSSVLDIIFLFSESAGWHWVRTSFAKWTASSLARPFPLFSFIVAIPIQEKEREDCQSIDKLNMNEQVIAQESKELTSTSTELVS